MADALHKANIAFHEQVPIKRFLADFLIADTNIIVECDGIYWHNAERDQRRDNELFALGYTILRFTDRQIKTNLADCIATIQAALYDDASFVE